MVDHPGRCAEQMCSGKHPAQMQCTDDVLYIMVNHSSVTTHESLG